MSAKKLHLHWNRHPLCEMRRTRWFGSWKFVESDLPRKLAVHNKEIWRIKRQVDLSNCNDSSSMIIQLNRN